MSLDLLNLPVWTIRPNWAGGVVERLEWLSSVHASKTSGSEQRQALRLSPRRSFEITTNPMKRERSYADLFLHRMAAQEMLFPLWHDQAKLTADLAAGGTALAFDNTYREHAVDQCALLYKDAFTWEVVYTDSMTGGGIVAADPVASAWPKGTTVFPLRAARLTADSNFSALTGTVGEAQLLFTMSRDNDFEEEDTFDVVYAGYPVLTIPPNRSEALDQSFQRLLAELDNSTGLRRVLDLPGRSFVTQVHGWTCNGRQQQYNIRKLLYYLRGRARAIWFPTFNDDVTVARNVLIGDSLIDIENIGYTYTGGAIDGRKQLLLKSGGVYEVATIDSVGAPLSPDEERLILESSLGIALSPGDTFSFMDTMRLDQDTVEITHHTDSEGVCEVAGAFRSFRNARDESAPSVHSIPVSAMSGAPCGSIITEFAGLSWLLPCLGSYSSVTCYCPAGTSDSYQLGGDPLITYDVVLRVRGVVELKGYTGGTVMTPAYVRKDATGSTSANANTYKLVVSDPPATYYLNNGVFNPNDTTAIDYETTIPMKGGATITLYSDAVDGLQVKNVGNHSTSDDDPGSPIVVVQPYNGQFMQIDGSMPL